MNQNAPLVVIAAGGTGGHMFPAQALAEVMLQRGWRVKLSTDDRGARYAEGFPDAVEIEEISSATFVRGGILTRLMVPFKILGGVCSTWLKMLKDPPKVVVGFGGYPSIPALTAAWMRRVPRMIHEQNGVLGRVNKLFARRVQVLACGTWPMQDRKGVNAVHVGNPVRERVMRRKGADYIEPGDYPMLLLVLGGSQGARVLSDVVPDAIAQLPPEKLQFIRVSHQAREEDVERVRAFYDSHGVYADVQTFFDNVAALMAEAQLIICRAGASTVAELGVIGRPSILIPYAAATNDHQSVNARSLVEAGAAVLIPESKLDAGALSNQIEMVIGNAKGANLMAQAALSVSMPDAPVTLANMVEKLAEEQAADEHGNETTG